MDELKRYGRTESIPYFVWAEGRNREAVARRGKGGDGGDDDDERRDATTTGGDGRQRKDDVRGRR